VYAKEVSREEGPAGFRSFHRSGKKVRRYLGVMSGFAIGVLVGALRVITSTPDALCPPVKAAEEALAARVGEVAGQEFTLHYRVARGKGGAQFLVVDLLGDASPDPVLHRELPLSELSCADAATVIAVQLENYFSSLSPRERPDSDAAPRETKATRGRVEQLSLEVRPRIEVRVVPPSPPVSEPVLREAEFGASLFRLEGGVGVTGARVPTVGLGFQKDTGRNWNVSLRGAVSLREQSFVAEDVSGTSYAGWVSAGVSHRWAFGRWGLALGPIVTLMLESARSTGPGLGGSSLAETGSAFRVVPGVGVDLRGEFSVSRSLGLFLGVDCGPLMGAFAPSFRVQGTPRAESVEVLRPSDFFFLGSVGIFIGL
jgi:hypothetical protein